MWETRGQALLESCRPSFRWPPAWIRGFCSQAAPYAHSHSPFVGCKRAAFPSKGCKVDEFFPTGRGRVGTRLQTSKSGQAGWEGEGRQNPGAPDGVRGARRAHVSSTRAQALAKHLGAGPAAHRHSAPLSHAAACCTLHGAALRSPLPSPPPRGTATPQAPEAGRNVAICIQACLGAGCREPPLFPLSFPGEMRFSSLRSIASGIPCFAAHSSRCVPPLLLLGGVTIAWEGQIPPFGSTWGAQLSSPMGR